MANVKRRLILLFFCSLILSSFIYADVSIESDADGEKMIPSHASLKTATPVAIPRKKATELLSEKITLNDPKASVLILATVQLVYTTVPTNKTVEVRLTRDAIVLETYTAQIGTAARAVSELPVTIHTWDTPGGGPHVYGVSAASNEPGVQATARRLTLAEFP